MNERLSQSLESLYELTLEEIERFHCILDCQEDAEYLALPEIKKPKKS